MANLWSVSCSPLESLNQPVEENVLQIEPAQIVASRLIDIDLGSIIKKRSITAHFQPIVSMRERQVLAVEALCRGVHPDNGLLIPPTVLFGLARSEGNLLALDRICRSKALDAFKHLGGPQKELMLNLNLEASLLDLGVLDSNYLVNAVRQLDLDPHRIVIEIVESRVRNLKALKQFSQDYKRYGFLIALDDVGAGYSDLARIAVIEPDLIKIDRGLVSGLDQNLHQKEVVRSLIELSHRIGALTIVEGVEREEEVVCALDLGADFLQGYYFAQPAHGLAQLEEACQRRIQAMAGYYLGYKQERLVRRHELYREFEQVVEHLVSQLSWAGPHEFARVLDELIGLSNSLECLYVLNARGIQITETVINPYRLVNRRKAIFKPAPLGSDQSLKDYYIMARSEQRKFISDPYISTASGQKRITIAASFRDQNGDEFILCCDFAQKEELEQLT
jgi:EAL domain-containing protein (putative c-di-GMP-specific phosphodiesterase class I)